MLSKVNRHILPLFCCLAMLCYLDRVNLAFAARQLKEDLGFSKAVYGFGSGARSVPLVRQQIVTVDPERASLAVRYSDNVCTSFGRPVGGHG